MTHLTQTTLSTRATAALAAAGITHSEQLVDMERRHLTRIPGVGRATANEIVKYILFSGQASHATISNGTLATLPLEVLHLDEVSQRMRSRSPFRTASLWGYRITSNAYGIGSGRDMNDDGNDRLSVVVLPDDSIVQVSPVANLDFIARLLDNCEVI